MEGCDLFQPINTVWSSPGDRKDWAPLSCKYPFNLHVRIALCVKCSLSVQDISGICTLISDDICIRIRCIS